MSQKRKDIQEEDWFKDSEPININGVEYVMKSEAEAYLKGWIKPKANGQEGKQENAPTAMSNDSGLPIHVPQMIITPLPSGWPAKKQIPKGLEMLSKYEYEHGYNQAVDDFLKAISERWPREEK